MTPGDVRARDVARRAVGLAAGAGVELPDSLALWRLAGGRPPEAVVEVVADPASVLGEALESSLTADDRRQGAHYTPASVAEQVASLALGGARRDAVVVDPGCGGGALLLAAGRALVARGARARDVARGQLWGADIDPLAAAVTEAAIALWSGEPPALGNVVVGDTLRCGAAVWSAAPAFDAVVGNPPFQGQLSSETARSAADVEVLRERFGAVVRPYVDTAALFLLVGVELLRPGGRAALVQPLSVVASRDAGPVRDALASRARLEDLWLPADRPFAASVHVCVPVLVAGDEADALGWTERLALAQGVPRVDVDRRAGLDSIAATVAGFRDEYYGLVPHVREAGAVSSSPLVTSGLIAIGSCAWGGRQARFAKERWERPEVDVAGVVASSPRLSSWLRRVQRPKVLVASQTRVIEAAADHAGTWVPATPVVSVVPHRVADVDRVAAALCSPVASAWAAGQAAGTAMSPGAMRISAGLVAGVPLPTDDRSWGEAAALLAAGDVGRYAEVATAMHRLPRAVHDEVLAWWSKRAKTDLASR